MIGCRYWGLLRASVVLCGLSQTLPWQTLPWQILPCQIHPWQTLLWGTAQAAVLSGVNVADTIVVDGRTLHLNGAGLRVVPVLNIDIYVAALYLAGPNHDAAAIMSMPGPKVIVLHFLHAASKSQVEGQFRKGERINCGDGECSKAALPDFEKLVAASPAVAVGDTSTFIYEPNRVRVLANDRLIGDYADHDLSEQLLRGFIGDHPPTDALKRALLGVDK